MAARDLLAGNYEPFLRFVGYPSIRPLLETKHFAPLASERRLKAYAVSTDGKFFRMKLQAEGYNDRFVGREGAAVLVYVCGAPEERRRQNLNRAGDEVTVELSCAAQGERHAVLRGTFLGIVAQRDVKPDGTSMLVAHSHIRIDAFAQPGGADVSLDAAAPAADAHPEPKRTRTPRAAPEHLFVDTESAAPFDKRLLGRAHDAFPILQHAFVRTDAAFARLASGCEYVRYPDELRDALGNDARSSVLKVGLDKLRSGRAVRRVLERIHDELERVVQTGGCLFAHNVLHDLRQLERTAQLVGHAWPEPRLVVRTIDTVRVASNFVPGADDRWMALADLARAGGIAAPTEPYHDAETDARVLWRIVAAHFSADALDAYVEPYTLGRGMVASAAEPP